MVASRAPQWKRYWNLLKHVEHPGVYLRRKLRLSSCDPVELTLKGGVKIRVPAPRLVEFKEITMDNVYLRGFRRAALAWWRGGQRTIMDVGANLGCFSLYAKAMFPRCRLIGLEPLPSNFAYYRQNIALNPQLTGDLVTVNAALASAWDASTPFPPWGGVSD